ncbi:hypothetical protein E4U53_007230 [Claviceps sorghi]|nr:hypothetical protein E4U53_007230 [Claviceps sorghi]
MPQVSSNSERQSARWPTEPPRNRIQDNLDVDDDGIAMIKAEFRDAPTKTARHSTSFNQAASNSTQQRPTASTGSRRHWVANHPRTQPFGSQPARVPRRRDAEGAETSECSGCMRKVRLEDGWRRLIQGSPGNTDICMTRQNEGNEILHMIRNCHAGEARKVNARFYFWPIVHTRADC